jgi:hypothetical protein
MKRGLRIAIGCPPTETLPRAEADGADAPEGTLACPEHLSLALYGMEEWPDGAVLVNIYPDELGV